uniref:Uncharacterized protein n=1 Tax=Utricularia reniformis TaxID=192314 RepID=A0A1Y0B001_9LAMI|nr:hypothetical protein AEK19_MT0453 [Utricularia reniformis]ART30714.1 hypothetical protein AEK19_MT0453 [Utricularia reniformis]
MKKHISKPNTTGWKKGPTGSMSLLGKQQNSQYSRMLLSKGNSITPFKMRLFRCLRNIRSCLFPDLNPLIGTEANC